jgi:adenylate cyclase
MGDAMTPQEFERKLSAIMSADVAGYSRLMGDDEDLTIRTLTGNREMLATLIKQYKGRVVDSPGDNLLAEFPSVTQAVNCAVEIQRELAERNAELPKERRMDYRIGVNLGDVVQEGERIYGDGVNIAARLESLAEPGGICISGIVYNQVKNRLKLEYEFLGKPLVKNISEPIPVYRILSLPKATARSLVHKEPVSFFPDKPSIAVLPFVNMSEDKDQEFFSDGLTEEIITALSKTAELFVIARNSSFVYKRKPVHVQQVSRELGVKYVLEGSVRKSGNQVRITAQLIDGMTGNHLWAERYDRELKEIFAIQDEVTIKIMASVTGRTVSSEEDMNLRAKGANNLEAYLKLMEASLLFQRFNRDDNSLAGKRLKEAIALDPQWAEPYARVSLVCAFDFRFNQSPESLKKAYEYAHKAISLDETQFGAYMALATVYSFQKRNDEAITAAEQAIKLAPGCAEACMSLGWSLLLAGRYKEALVYLERALRMNPFPPTHWFLQIGSAHLFLRNYEEAVSALKKAVSISSKNQIARFMLMVAFYEMGRLDEARTEAEELLMIDPKWDFKEWLKTSPFKDLQVTKRWVEAIKSIGFKGEVGKN